MRSLVRAWRAVHRWPWTRRLPLKLSVLAVVIGLCLYPRLWLIPTWVGRLLQPASVLQPDHPELPALADRVRTRVGADATPPAVLEAVQAVVNARVPYAWDWDTWGVMDYLPTVDETLAAGREDCDGRAVVSASLLKHMGYEAWLASDLLHVWVVTPVGETMGPSVGGQMLVQTDDGARIAAPATLLVNLVRGATFGLAVFPLGREVVILVTVVLVLLQPRSSVPRRLLGAAGCIGGFVLLRMIGEQSARVEVLPVGVWAGLGLIVLGLLLLSWPGRSAAPATAGNATLAAGRDD